MTRIPILWSVVCPYCKAGIGEPCSINRRNVSIAVLGVHKPRAQRAQRTPGRTVVLRAGRGEPLSRRTPEGEYYPLAWDGYGNRQYEWRHTSRGSGRPMTYWEIALSRNAEATP